MLFIFVKQEGAKCQFKSYKWEAETVVLGLASILYAAILMKIKYSFQLVLKPFIKQFIFTFKIAFLDVIYHLHSLACTASKFQNLIPTTIPTDSILAVKDRTSLEFFFNNLSRSPR